MQTVRPWPEKFQRATMSWQTAPYDGIKLLANLEREISAREHDVADNRTSAFERLTIDELKQYAEFVRTRL